MAVMTIIKKNHKYFSYLEINIGEQIIQNLIEVDPLFLRSLCVLAFLTPPAIQWPFLHNQQAAILNSPVHCSIK